MGFGAFDNHKQNRYGNQQSEITSKKSIVNLERWQVPASAGIPLLNLSTFSL